MVADVAPEILAVGRLAGRLLLDRPQPVRLDQPADFLNDGMVRFDRRVLAAFLAQERRHEAAVRAVQPVVWISPLAGPGFPGHGPGHRPVTRAARLAAMIDLNGLCLINEVSDAVAGDTGTLWVRELGHEALRGERPGKGGCEPP